MSEKLLNVNTNGNKKLVNNAEVRFMIWNLPAVTTCPYATESCKNACYARKAERVYPQVLPSRQANFTDSVSDDFVENMIYTIETNARKKSFAGKKIVFRIHESGDFYNKAYADKWLKIVEYFAASKIDIVFIAYSKSLVYFDGVELPDNFFLRASVWCDTSNENLQIIDRNWLPIYTACTAEELPVYMDMGFAKCDCKDCANCGMCWNSDYKNIVCVIH